MKTGKEQVNAKQKEKNSKRNMHKKREHLSTPAKPDKTWPKHAKHTNKRQATNKLTNINNQTN